MCQVFISADPQLYAHRARSVRLHGVATLNTANGISMVLATESESAAVALTLSR